MNYHATQAASTAMRRFGACSAGDRRTERAP
jgi:hypothetical protein